MSTDKKRYYPYRAFLIRVMMHPQVMKYSAFRIDVQKEIVMGASNTARYSAAVYLDCDDGEKRIELYRPTHDHDERAQACALLLRKWLSEYMSK